MRGRTRAAALVAAVVGWAASVPPTAGLLPGLEPGVAHAQEAAEPRQEDAGAPGAPGARAVAHAVAHAAELERAGEPGEARDVLEELLEAAVPGTPAHRAAGRALFRLEAGPDGSPERAARLYRRHLEVHSEPAPERADMAVALAAALVRDGDPSEAERVLEGAATTLEREPARAVVDAGLARLAFLRGRPARAAALLRGRTLLSGPDPAGRTDAIELLEVLERADSAEVAVVGAGLLRLARDPGEVTAAALLHGLERRPPSAGRPSLLALLARELDAAGRPGEAAAARRHLVERHPDAPEAPAAMLELARSALERAPDEAEAWLERLVLTHPESAVSPVARRLLAELRDRVPGP